MRREFFITSKISLKIDTVRDSWGENSEGRGVFSKSGQKLILIFLLTLLFNSFCKVQSSAKVYSFWAKFINYMNKFELLDIKNILDCYGFITYGIFRKTIKNEYGCF